MIKKLKNKLATTHGFKKIALLVSLILLSTAIVGSTLSYIVVKTPTLVNIFINGLNPEGNLTVSKTLEHPFGSDYTLPDGLNYDFQFWVDGYAGETISTSVGNVNVDNNGYFNLTIPNNGSVTLYELEEDTTVWVKETMKPGYTLKKVTPDSPKVTNGQDGCSKGIVISEGNNALQFTNIYTPGPVQNVNLTVNGTKTLTGRDWKKGDSFTFQLDYETQPDTWTSLGTKTVTYSASNKNFNKFSFTDLIQGLTFDSVGTYSFRVREVEQNLGGITYDSTSRYFDVVVGDADLDGYLEIQSVSLQNKDISADSNGTFNVVIPIENSYAPAGSAEVILNINKSVDDKSGQKKTPAGYTFQVTDNKGNVIKTSEATTAAGETTIKLVFEASQAGKSFTYTLSEVNGGTTKNGLTYDGTKHTLKISVKDNKDGTVSATVNSTGSNTASYSFVNTYAPTAAKVTLSGTKTLTGRDLIANEFKFDLYETGSDFSIGKNAKPSFTASNDAKGKFSFNEMVFSKPGIYYYAVCENVSAKLTGVTYDDSVYGITVKVTDGGNGKLAAAMSISLNGKSAKTIKFTNTYAVEDDSRENDTPWLSDDHYNYIIGKPDGKVHPTANITRAEVATIFYRLLNDQTRKDWWHNTEPYPDVEEDDWYYNAVCALTYGGIMEGYPNGNFGPNDEITRAELATVLCRFDTKYGLLDTSSTFSDIEGHWAEDYIKFAATRKYILGYVDGTFKPTQKITRSETVAMVNRLIRRNVDEEGLIPGYIVWPDNKPGSWCYYEMIEATVYHDYVRSDRKAENQTFMAEDWTKIYKPIDWAKAEQEWILVQTGK